MEIVFSLDLLEVICEVLIDCVLCMVGVVCYWGIGIFEFLVDEECFGCFYFMEVNLCI